MQNNICYTYFDIYMLKWGHPASLPNFMLFLDLPLFVLDLLGDTVSHLTHRPSLLVLRTGGVYLPSSGISSSLSCPLQAPLETWGSYIQHTKLCLGEKSAPFLFLRWHLQSSFFFFPFPGCSPGKYFGPNR